MIFVFCFRFSSLLYFVPECGKAGMGYGMAEAQWCVV